MAITEKTFPCQEVVSYGLFDLSKPYSHVSSWKTPNNPTLVRNNQEAIDEIAYIMNQPGNQSINSRQIDSFDLSAGCASLMVSL